MSLPDQGSRPSRSALASTPGRLLLAALLCTALACLPLHRTEQQPVFTYIAVVDITRSMTVEDYPGEAGPRSRLAAVRSALRRLAADLPCGSRLGLGVFTERNSTLLFEPIETCGGYPALVAALDKLDWRMAWAADSRIAAGLVATLELLGRYDARLLFFTDGQEAPPINPRYRIDFAPLRGRLRGMIVGTGGLNPMPIPKFDEFGKRVGHVEADEVPHRSTFGLSELAPEAIEGYHARNAPFGNASANGTEHLSSLREAYLTQLADQAGLEYHRLETDDALLRAATQPRFAGQLRVAADARWLPGMIALGMLLTAYLFDVSPLGRRLAGIRQSRKRVPSALPPSP